MAVWLSTDVSAVVTTGYVLEKNVSNADQEDYYIFRLE